jgi:DNA polymerase-4
MSLSPRVILHLDMNSFFASVEQQKNPALRGRPVVVGGAPGTRSIVAAASREAKRYGIKTAMRTSDAQRLCPQLEFVYPDFDAYVDIHRRLIDIVTRFTDAVEVFSIDEVFMDVTDMMVQHRGSAVQGVQATRMDKKTATTLRQRSDAYDVYGAAEDCARRIKAVMAAELGEWLTCSVGIAPNKLLAKLGSDLKKPDGLITIRPEEAVAYLDRAQLQDICGIGMQIYRRLYQLGIRSFADLRGADVGLLRAEFGVVRGTWLHEAAWGRDDDPVIPHLEMPAQKSFSKQHTLVANTRDPAVLKPVLYKLAEIVGRKMRAEDKRAMLVFWYVRWEDMTGAGGHVRMTRPVADGLEIYRHAWDAILRHGIARPVRLVSVGVADLVTPTHEQLDLFVDLPRQQRVLAAMDRINDIYGELTVRRGLLLDPSQILEAATNAMQRRHA